MRMMIPIVALLVITSLATAVSAQDETAPETETSTYEGVVGCSFGAGLVATADKCGDTTFAYGPSFDGATGMEITFSYQAALGEKLQLKFYGPPGGALDAGTHAFGPEQVLNKSYQATFDVRADTGLALDTPFQVEIVFYYGENPSDDVVVTSAESDDTTTFSFDGILGCSVGFGPLKVADRCGGEDEFAFTAPKNVTGLTVTLTWDDALAKELSFELTGPPATKVSGTSPVVATYDNTSFENFQNGWDGTVGVRAANGIALDTAFTVVLEFTTA